MTLQELRAEIDQLDRQIVELLNQRARLSQQVGLAKRELAEPNQESAVYQPNREAEVYAHVAAVNTGPLPDSALLAIYREILSSSRALQRPLRVAYLGPVATFSYEAAKRHFGTATTLVPCRTIGEVFVETQKQTVDYGVVPIENSIEGAVSHTLDLLLDTDLLICAEIELPVTQNLLSRGTLEQIRRVYSHPQALAQCRRWLSEWLPRATQIETASTALAAQLAQEPDTAAIAPEAASEAYGLPIVARRIEDVATNVTRFLVIGSHMSERSGCDRSAVSFAVDDRAGALQDALRWFAENAINLTHIVSRPSRRRLWEYVFFIELEGHPADEHVARALEGLKRSCSFVRVLGAWPVAHKVRRQHS